MTRSDLVTLLEQLSDRDLAILDDLERFRLLSARQIQRLHFVGGNSDSTASMRAANRALGRLRRHDLVRTLARRVGGVRAGSAGFVYYLGPVGDRLQRHHRGEPGPRRRYSEPSWYFVEHTLAVAELAVQTIEASRTGAFDILQLTPEPGCWQSSLSPEGVTQWLKPDLLLVTAAGDYENHWFIEVDLSTEHLPVVLRQCAAYQAHRDNGRYQAEHGLFPAVLWVAPDERRATAIRVAIRRQSSLDPSLFRVSPGEHYREIIATDT